MFLKIPDDFFVFIIKIVQKGHFEVPGSRYLNIPADI